VDLDSDLHLVFARYGVEPWSDRPIRPEVPELTRRTALGAQTATEQSAFEAAVRAAPHGTQVELFDVDGKGPSLLVTTTDAGYEVIPKVDVVHCFYLPATGPLRVLDTPKILQPGDALYVGPSKFVLPPLTAPHQN
jgi:hypothetical protein